MDCHFIGELKKFLEYDPASGVFTWIRSCGTARAGQTAGVVRKIGYRALNFKKKRYYCHRLAWLFVHGSMPEFVIDHIDGDRDNNAIHNLRDVPQIVNFHNRTSINSNNTTGLAGVSRGGRAFVAQIMVNRKRIHLGVFDTAEDAHFAYKKAKAELCLS